MRRLLSSPRRRRRAMWLGSLLLVLGGVLAIEIMYRDTAEKAEPDAAAVAPRPAQVYREPKTVRLTKAERDAALRNALRFVNTAVARRRVERSYDLVTPELRQGFSRSDWGRGEIPVVPFPAAEVRARVDYSYSNEIGLTMLLLPPAGSRTPPATFNMDLRVTGPAGKREWLVNSWTPTANVTEFAAGQEGGGGAQASGFPNVGAAAEAQRGLEAPLGAVWIVLPLSVIGLALLIPIGLGVRSWVQNRRALRAYEASRPLDV